MDASKRSGRVRSKGYSIRGAAGKRRRQGAGIWHRDHGRCRPRDSEPRVGDRRYAAAVEGTFDDLDPALARRRVLEKVRAAPG
jgi:hypothetical protein